MHQAIRFLAALLPIFCRQSRAEKNVLLIIVDDLRPELGSLSDVSPYFNPKMKTPNLDALARRSIVLKQNYCQVPLCNPGRSSFLTARRTEDTHVLEGPNYFREMAGNFTTLPQYFKDMGYQSIGVGKIFHYGPGTNFGDPPSWSVPHFQADNPWKGKSVSWYSVTPEEREERPLQDDGVKARALEVMQNLSIEAAAGVMDPFFLAVGFHSLHLPYNIPEEFYDLYPLDEVELPKFQYVPSDFPEIGWSGNTGPLSYKDIQALSLTGEYNTTLPDDWVLDLRRGYYAGVSFVDDMIGELIDELETLGLADNTIIAFLGDKGYLLGEHGMFAKNSIFELIDSTPMMIHAPGLTDEGIQTSRLTENIDLIPTLVELAGLPQIPLCPSNDPNNVILCRQGTSFVPLIQEPERAWKPYAFTMMPHYENEDVMGYSVISDDGLRYMNWVAYDKLNGLPDWNARIGEELYNHTADPYENVNLAVSNDASIRLEKRRMRRAIKQVGWQGANPEELYNL